MLTTHVLISLLGIAVGIVLVYGLLHGSVSAAWVATFLVVHALTSLTGFPLEPFGFDPPRAIGILALMLLIFAAAAYYGTGLGTPWRAVFIISTLVVLYLDAFVGVIQAFQKIGPLQRLAPTQSEAPFVIAQAAVLMFFVGVGVVAFRRFNPPHLGARAV
jgi:hypothetical protein